MKNTISDMELNNKKVIIRVDYNVPIKNGVITDDFRIKESTETILYALNSGATLVLFSHLGKVKTKEDMKDNSLLVVANRLSEILDRRVDFCPVSSGPVLKETVNNMEKGDILLVENTRFEDIDGKKESNCDMGLAESWAELGDLFINDAYGTIHRKHASNYGIASFLPSALGFLTSRELKIMHEVMETPKHPFVVILGGAKVSDKIKLIDNLASKADNVIICGAMAFTFLKALGYNVGSSLVDEESIEFCKEMILKYQSKLMLPFDFRVATKFEDSSDNRLATIKDFYDNEMGLDVGPRSVNYFAKTLSNAKTIIWNGPVGVFEFDNYKTATIDICEILVQSGAKVVVGGGDSAAACKKFGYDDKFYHISTGGGATLSVLQGDVLESLEIIGELNEQ